MFIYKKEEQVLGRGEDFTYGKISSLIVMD
jgi:hypothetical protein